MEFKYRKLLFLNEATKVDLTKYHILETQIINPNVNGTHLKGTELEELLNVIIENLDLEMVVSLTITWTPSTHYEVSEQKVQSYIDLSEVLVSNRWFRKAKAILYFKNESDWNTFKSYFCINKLKA